jgi:hypothetical protein
LSLLAVVLCAGEDEGVAVEHPWLAELLFSLSEEEVEQLVGEEKLWHEEDFSSDFGDSFLSNDFCRSPMCPPVTL